MPLPWELQTWDGNSLNEIQYKQARLTQAHYGFGLLILGSIAQLLGLIKSQEIEKIKKYFRKNN
jgi:hypothetical protein